MNVNKRFFQFCLFCFIAMAVQGQIHVKDKPYSFKNKLQKREVQLKHTPQIDSSKIAEEDKNDTKNGLPPRFGIPFPVNYDLENSGTWTILPDSSRLWELTIACNKSLSINLLFDKFWLPDSAKFYIYNEQKSQVLGAFTSANNKGTKENPDAFATGLVYGDTIHLELFEPKKLQGKSAISISTIVHGYRYITVNKANEPYLNTAGPCNININCTEGTEWQTEKGGITLILVGGVRLCTGCLINNTAQDGTPYLLTANHCLQTVQTWDAETNPNANTWTFMWNYESPDCMNQDAINVSTTSGATVVANGSNCDFALLRLSESPNNIPAIYYCGWDRTGNTPDFSVGIHHPRNDIKKISIDNDPPEITGYDTNICSNLAPVGNTHWRVINWNKGVTEGGSSGSPMFDQNHRIIGQLHGGCSDCNDEIIGLNHFGPNESDYYGRLAIAWNSSTNPKRRLKDWLDPFNT